MKPFLKCLSLTLLLVTPPLQADEKAKKAAADEEVDEEDADLINPNHVTKKMTISDLGSSRELTRRERCAYSN